MTNCLNCGARMEGVERVNRAGDSISRQVIFDSLMTAVAAVGVIDGDDIKLIFDNLPSAEPEIIRCKDCKHRDEDECPMRYVEWVTYEEDGYFESDDVVHDRTLDDGFCDRWEKDDTDE